MHPIDTAHSTIDTEVMNWDFRDSKGMIISSILALLRDRKVKTRQDGYYLVLVAREDSKPAGPHSERQHLILKAIRYGLLGT